MSTEQDKGKKDGRGGYRENGGRKPGGRNKTTLMAMSFRQQILESSYSPLVVMQKNIEWTQGEAERLETALAGIDAAALLAMDAEKVRALNEARAQSMALRARANDFAAQSAPYVQPKVVPIDDPIELDIQSLVSPDDLVTASNNLMLAIATGEISPEQGAKVSAILENRRKAIETQDLEKRLKLLEANKR